jgi:hypothetical protein
MLTSWRRILTLKALALSLVGLGVVLGIAISRQRRRGSALPITPPATET